MRPDIRRRVSPARKSIEVVTYPLLAQRRLILILYHSKKAIPFYLEKYYRDIDEEEEEELPEEKNK